jgi:hypothetical protein
VGSSAITRWASVFTVAHALGWARPRSRRGPPSYSTRSSSIAESPQHGIQFYKWLQQLGVDNRDDVEKEPLDEEEDAAGGYIKEFDRLDISSDIDNIADEDLFNEEVVDKGNIFN